MRYIAFLVVVVALVMAAACSSPPPTDEYSAGETSELSESSLATEHNSEEADDQENAVSENSENGDGVAIATSTPVKTTVETTSGLTIECSLDTKDRQISCNATGKKRGSQLTWSSTAAWSTGGGSNWSFTIEDELLEATVDVSLEECIDSSCQTTKASIDTSTIFSGNLDSSSDIQEEDFRMRLPFTEDNEPLGIMPMGETIEHPIPGGHPGWDFQWDHQATIVAVADGEVVEIISGTHLETGIFFYSVAIVTGNFIVNYTTLESVHPDITVGSRVVAGQAIGKPTPVQKGHDWYMIHWDFGTYEKHEPRANPEGVISEYETTKVCPVPYLTESERQRIFRLWKTAFYGEKDQFPYLCNGPWKNYDSEEVVSFEPTVTATPVSATLATTTATPAPDAVATRTPVPDAQPTPEPTPVFTLTPTPVAATVSTECGSLGEMFVVFPIDANIVTHFARPGRTGTDYYLGHGALHADTTPFNQIEVKFPAEGFSLYSVNRRLEEYWVDGRHIDDDNEQVKLIFKHPCGIEVMFDHLTGMTERWAEIIKDVPVTLNDSRVTFMPEDEYWVEAAEVLAKGIGHPKNTYLDFGVYDYRKKNDSAEMIERDWPDYASTASYGICWSNLFGPEVEKTLEETPPGLDSPSDYCDSDRP